MENTSRSFDELIHLAGVLPCEDALASLAKLASPLFGYAAASLEIAAGVLPTDWPVIGYPGANTQRMFRSGDVSLSEAGFPAVILPVLDRRQQKMATLTLIDAQRQATAEEQSNRLSILASFMEAVRLHEAGRHLSRLIQHANKFEKVLETLFNVCLFVIRADRGDLMFYSWTKGELFVHHTDVGAQPAKPTWYSGPVGGLIDSVWLGKDDEAILNVPNVHAPAVREIYRCYDERVRSELLLRLQRNGRRIAVLNFESFTEAWFDARDESALKWLAELAGEQFEILGKQMRYQSLAKSLLQPDNPLEDIASEVMKGIRGIYGFDRGLIYFPNRDGTLRAYAEIGFNRDFNRNPFEFPVSERSFTRWLLDNDSDWVENPWQDPLDRFSERGLVEFNIPPKPLLGVPLRYGNQAIGALVLWSEKNPPPRPDDIARVAPFAQYAALVVAGHKRVADFRVFQKEVGKVLAQMAVTLDLETNLRAVMRGLLTVGFDRVRVFQFRHGDSMNGLYSEGMGDYAFEVKPYVASIDPEASPDFHPLVKNLVDRLKANDPEALAPMLCNGLDPHAERLDKVGLPEWLDMPLVSASKLFGELAADRRLHPDRRITEEDRVVFTVFGNLAARAFAIDEKRGMLPATILKQVYHRVATESDRMTLLKSLLHALTHGNGGLGFSRGLYLEPDPSSGRLQVVQGIGSTSHEEFTSVAQMLRNWDLDSVLDRATPNLDKDIAAALDRYSRNCGRPFDMPMPICCTTDAVECRDPDLNRLLGSHAGAMPVIAIVKGGNEIFGAIVADRMWQVRNLTESDRATVGTFSEIVGQILFTHELQRQLREEANLANLGLYASTLAHELRTPLQILRHDVDRLDARARAMTPDATAEAVGYISRNFKRIDSTIQRCELLAVPRFADTDLAAWFLSFADEVRPLLTNQGVTFHYACAAPPPRARICEPALHLALDNLVRNAIRAAAKQPPGMGVVTLKVGHDRDHLLAEVIDNGPGLSEAAMQAIRQFKVGFTTSAGRGLGAGLLIVRRVAYIHRGKFQIESNIDGPGTRAMLTISLKVEEDFYEGAVAAGR